MNTSDSSSTPPKRSKALWLWVIAAFVILITAWSTLIYIAQTHKPELIDVEQTDE